MDAAAKSRGTLNQSTMDLMSPRRDDPAVVTRLQQQCNALEKELELSHQATQHARASEGAALMKCTMVEEDMAKVRHRSYPISQPFRPHFHNQGR